MMSAEQLDLVIHHPPETLFRQTESTTVAIEESEMVAGAEDVSVALAQDLTLQLQDGLEFTFSLVPAWRGDGFVIRWGSRPSGDGLGCR
jgi:hypothetical protein